jgi:ribosome-associated protein
MIRITPQLEIAEGELRFESGPSSGPGGQNVNKVETRITLRFDLGASSSLDEAQKGRLRERLATRISKRGILRVTSQRHRTREANRRAALERFVELVAEALHEGPPRRPTRPTRAARKRRLDAKRRRGRLKAERRESAD